jgi:hypothetical protein
MLRTVVIIATIIVGIFSVLFLIGLLAERNGPQVPIFEGVSQEDAEERVRKYTNHVLCTPRE